MLMYIYLCRIMFISCCADGLNRPEAYRVVKTLSTREDLLLRTVQEKVLGLGTADISQPVKAGAVMFASFTVGALVPLAPFFFAPPSLALYVAWGLSILALLGVGAFKGVLTNRPLARSSIEFAALAGASAAAGWLVGMVFAALGAVDVGG